MKRFALLVSTVFALSAMPAAAQISVYGGGGPAIPGGDFDNVDSGIILVGGVTYDINPRVAVYGEGAWGQHDVGSSDVNPSSLMAGLLVGLTDDEDAPLSPYVFGGAGAQTVEDETEFGFQLGAGVNFDLLGLGAFAEGRWHRASFESQADIVNPDDVVFSLFSIILGFGFDLGGGN